MKKKKILLASGIFFPDVGGPAIHVKKIADHLQADGFDVVVIAYGEKPIDINESYKVIRISRKWPKTIQWSLYFLHVLYNGFSSSLIYAFDPTAAGLPASIVSKVLRKPFIIRVGGDPIWERVVEKNKRFVTIESYYKDGLYLKDSPRLYKVIMFVLRRAKALVVYNQFFKDFYSTYFNVISQKIRIVKNPIFKRTDASPNLPEDPIIIFAGRFVSYKNLPFVIKSFDNVRQKIGKGKLILVGHGPEEKNIKDLAQQAKSSQFILFKEKLSQEKLFELIKSSALSIAPALNEFNPNFILESLSFGKPVLISRGNGLSVLLPEEFMFDPFNQNDFENKIEEMLTEEGYLKAVNKVKSLEMNQTWEMVMDFHSNLIKEIIGN